MEYSKNFNKIKEYYDQSIWDMARIWNVVDKKIGITKVEYQEITGVEYQSELPTF